MNLGRLKWLLEQLTPEQLAEPALVFSSYFGRLYEVKAFDHLQNLTKEKKTNPLVLAISSEPLE